MAAAALPPEAELLALAGRFAEAEQLIRALLGQAVDGDRRELLREALAILLGLRREAQGAGAWVALAYAVAAAAAGALTGRPVATGARAGDLGRSLAHKLDRGVLRAEQGSRGAFATVRPDNLDEAAQDAVTARIDRRGRRHPLGAEAGMLAATIGRHATTRATFDVVSSDALVEISTVGGACPICLPRQGVFVAARAPRPPFHPSCDCAAKAIAA